MNTHPSLVIRRLPHAEGLPLPAYQSAGAAGLDLIAAVAEDEGQVRPRSGLAAKHGLTVLNAPGTIDADYRGEVGVLLVNLGTEPVTIARGDRIAQLVVAPVLQVAIEEVDALPDTARGGGGFGSTGGLSGRR